MTTFYTGFAATLREETAHVWGDILDHPFLRGLGDGSLAFGCYRTYLAQDYLYLVYYARALALAAAYAKDLEGMSFYSRQLEVTLRTEMGLHRRRADEFGLEEADLLATVPHPVTRAYGRHLIETGRRREEPDLVAALLPCAVGYVEIATTLAARGLPKVDAYREWIETYASRPMKEMSASLVHRLNQAAGGADDGMLTRWLGAYLTSSELELRFFEMAWSERPRRAQRPSPRRRNQA